MNARFARVVEAARKLPESELEQWQEKVSWSRRMLALGYTNAPTVNAEEAKLQAIVSQASVRMDLSPAQGGIVEFTTAEDGLYPVVTHAFNFVGRGALGLIQAGDGDPAN